MNDRPKINLVISDTHCGSDVALMPPEIKTDKGNVVSIGENLHQRWLWEQWNIQLDKAWQIIGTDPFVFTHTGDAIEGIHHHSAEVVATKWKEHLDIAKACLGPIAKRAHSTFIVKGTECHTQDLENDLASTLLAVDGKAKDKWLYRIHGCLIDAAHHIGTTSRMHLEASAYSINMANARGNYSRSNQECPKVYLRGHRHVGGHFSDGISMLGITGAWQFLTRYGHKVVPDSIPSPSIFVLDWRNKEPGTTSHGQRNQIHPTAVTHHRIMNPTCEELLDSAQASLDMLKQCGVIKEDAVPEAFKTTPQWAEAWNISESHAQRLIRAGKAEGKTVERKFRIRNGAGLRLISHYAFLKPTDHQ